MVMFVIQMMMMKFMRWSFTIDRSPIEGRGKPVVGRVNDLDCDDVHEDEEDDDEGLPPKLPPCRQGASRGGELDGEGEIANWAISGFVW